MPSKFGVRARTHEIYTRIGGSDLVRQGRPLLAATLLASIAVYAFQFYASRQLGVVAYGTIASLLAAITLIALFSNVGATVIARFAAEFQAAGDPGRLRRLLDLVAWASATCVVVSGGLSFILGRELSSFLRMDRPIYVELGALVAGLTVSGYLFRGVLQGVQHFNPYALSMTLENVGRAVLGSLGIALGWGIGGALLGQVSAGIATVGYTYGFLRRSTVAPPVALSIDMRRLLMTSGAIALASVGLAILQYFDIILAKHFLNPHDAGLYGFATLPGRALSGIVGFLPILILPKATANAVAGKRGHSVLLGGIAVASAILVGALAFLYLFPGQLVAATAGPAFVGAAPLVFPYGCAAGLSGLAGIAASYKIGRHRFDFVLPLAAIALAEIAGIVLFHSSALMVIRVVLGANALACLPCFYRINAAAS